MVLGYPVAVIAEQVGESSEVERLVAANERARELLKWAPQYGSREGLRRGLEQTIAWFRSNAAHYRSTSYEL